MTNILCSWRADGGSAKQQFSVSQIRSFNLWPTGQAIAASGLLATGQTKQSSPMKAF